MLDMNKIPFDQVLCFQQCPMRWYYRYIKQIDYLLSREELYNLAYRATLEYYMSMTAQDGYVRKDYVATKWVDEWLSRTAVSSLTENEIVSMGAHGLDQVMNVITYIRRHFYVLDGPFGWMYNMEEDDLAVYGTTLGLLKSKHLVLHRRDVYAYYVLEILPESYRLWGCEASVRLLQVASRSCRQFLQGDKRRKDRIISGTLALHSRRNEHLISKQVKVEDEVLQLMRTIVEQMYNLSIVPFASKDKCGYCPYVKHCNIHHLGKRYIERLDWVEKLERELCTTPNLITHSSSTLQAMREDIMGYRSQ
jgi:hypothetical protein